MPTRSRSMLLIAGALGLTLPGIVLRLSGSHPKPAIGAFLFGLAIVSSAFLLAWASEAAQLDVSRGLALVVLALIAVLPEYAVDAVFASKAGKNPKEFAPLALANMTGGNRLLIGIGWPLTVFLAVYAAKRRGKRGEHVQPISGIALERSHTIDLTFLALACVYSLTLPLRRTLTIFDALVLVAIFAWYVSRIFKAPTEEPHLVGPAAYIGSFATPRRRIFVVLLLAWAAGAILACAEPFAEALVETGRTAGIDEFLLVQWLAPIASESPELMVAGLFAWRLNTNSALGALLSSKVNQWTLLVGTLPVVFAISSGGLHGLPIDHLQREELFLTAAQSVFAVAVLTDLTLGLREAGALLGLFLVQFVLGGVLSEDFKAVERVGTGCLYLVLALIIFWHKRQLLRPLVRDGFRTPILDLFDEAPYDDSLTDPLRP